MYTRLKQLHDEVKNHTDLTYKSLPFFTAKVMEIKVELRKVSMEQGEQVSRDVMDAIRFVGITEMEDLNMVPNYPREVPKYLGRVRDTLLAKLAFVHAASKKGRR